MELENFCSTFITTFYLVEYLSGFESDRPISEVLVFLEADLKHYLDKKSKGLTIRDKFEIIQTKFFIEAIKNACKVKPFKQRVT